MSTINNPLAFRSITGTENFTPEQEKLRKHSMDVGQQIVEEGCILLKNNGLLPLATRRINVFGALAAQPYLGGRGSSCADNSKAVGFYTALENAGVEYNSRLYNLYKNWVHSRKASEKTYPQERTTQKFKKASILSTVVEVCSKPYLKELPANKLTDELLQNARAYSDTAVVMLGRSGSEQHDMTPPELALMPQERAMLEKVCTVFEKVVLLLNTAGIFELGFVEEFPSILAVLSIGYPARTGMHAVVRILTGQASPSGRLVDTFYYRTADHPAWPNVGTHKYSNAKKRCFLMYKEDIYVGYRYTETFLTEQQYQNAVQFPFGFGLSYTDFAWNDCEITRTEDGLCVGLTVTNTGSYAGKDVVEVYVRQPYTGRVEKAGKVLAAFQKTKKLQPSESQRLMISFPLYAIMSYSTADAAYLLEAGEYEIQISRDAHTVVQSLAYHQEKEILLHNDPATGAPIQNRFAAYEGNFHRLCRQDGTDVKPEAPSEIEHIAPESIVDYPNLQKKPPVRGGEMPIFGANNGVKLPDLKEKTWDDPAWDGFLDQFTPEEMIHLVAFGGYQTTPLERLGIPGTIASDGPAGIHDSVTRRPGVSYPSGTTIASTWNPELAGVFGEAIGMEASFMNVQEWYGPSMNLHRSPFGGRCFEYYSEDPLLSGKIAAATVRGAQSKGLVCHIKHFALNEEDRQRLNVHTWCSEQAIREIYCKPFEYAVKEGGAKGVMSALNCIGADWCGESSALQTGLLRDEWNFQGCVVTDYAGAKYQRADTGVLAGNNLWLAPVANEGYVKSLRNAYAADPAGFGRALRASVKGICWMVLHTNAVNTVICGGKNANDA